METGKFLGTDQFPAVSPTSDDKMWAILAHGLTFVSSFLAPLIIWLIKKDDSPFVAAHAKESLNFQITVFISYFICAILAFLIVGFFLMGILSIAVIVLVIVASVKASESKLYRYPFNLRLIK